MGRRTQTHQDSPGGDSHSEHCPGPDSCPDSETQGRPSLNIGPILARTIRHFFPDLNDWIDEDFPDSREPRKVVYHRRFLVWIGVFLFLAKLGSRRQIDFQLSEKDTEVLGNLNRLAGTEQKSMPTNQTMDNYLASVGTKPLEQLRQRMIHRLVRMRVLDSTRLQGNLMVLIDGTGYLVFKERHCEHCLTRKCGEKTIYMHQALEAKLLGPGGMVLSIGTEFIDNRDWDSLPEGTSQEDRKQDCELKALRRLCKKIREEHPQLSICLSGDALNACGEGFQIGKDFNMRFIHVFKEGRMPALWEEFNSLLELCPQRKVEVTTPEGVQQVFRWVNDMDYVDSDGRQWKLHAIRCDQTDKEGKKSTWAWLIEPEIELTAETVVEVASEGGRTRWCIENQGFNVQKNSELNMEHAYSEGEHWGVYYLLLQIAHIILQLLERGSLLLNLAKKNGKDSAVELFGSLKNIATKMLESLRNLAWPEEAFKPAKIQIRFNTS